jgi:hypothetical protein
MLPPPIAPLTKRGVAARMSERRAAIAAGRDYKRKYHGSASRRMYEQGNARNVAGHRRRRRWAVAQDAARPGHDIFVTSKGLARATLAGLDGGTHTGRRRVAAGAGDRAGESARMPASTTRRLSTRRPHRHRPWQNAKGVAIARSVDDLHSASTVTKDTSLDEGAGQRRTE